MRRIWGLVLVAAMVAVLAPPAGAMKISVMEVVGAWDDGEMVHYRSGDRTVRLGLRVAGEGTVSCISDACFEKGYDGTTFRSLRRFDLTMRFTGGGEAVVSGRSQGLAIFTDGFESGDVSRVRGTADCAPLLGGGSLCDLDLTLRSGHKGGVDLGVVMELAIFDGDFDFGVDAFEGTLSVVENPGSFE